jgi:hypothetical protein
MRGGLSVDGAELPHEGASSATTPVIRPLFHDPEASPVVSRPFNAYGKRFMAVDSRY